MTTITEQQGVVHQALVNADTELAKMEELIKHQRSLINNMRHAFRQVNIHPPDLPPIDLVDDPKQLAENIAGNIADLDAALQQGIPQPAKPPAPAKAPAAVKGAK